jgi:signal transduction histidine kinase/CheY-like chemotaxis protein
MIRPASLEQRSTAVSYLSGAVVVPDAALDRQLLRRLLERFIGHSATQRILTETGTTASASEVRAAERALAGVLGTASARLLIDALSQRRGMEAAEVAAIVSQAGQVVQFNRELLEVVFAHISQGVSVVDKELRLVAWNQRYQELFNYPDELLTPGRPIADLVRHNAERGWCGVGSVDDHVQKRLRWLTQSTHHRFERQRSDGIVLEMHGQPLPGGGFVTTFNDVTEYKRTQDELEQLNRALEARVAERTAALAHARDEAEQANLSKGRFLAATSHDLAQPLNAARLLVSSLQAQQDSTACVEDKNRSSAELLPQLSVVLDNAEALLIELQEMSRLERGLLNPNPQVLELQQLFQQLRTEFLPMVQQKGLDLHVAQTQLRVISDERMLHRILQNLLANAVRYTRKGGIVLGARRMGAEQVRIEVWDSGSGIEQDQSEFIFEEFQRGKDAAGTGLGLGLSITKRLAELMGHHLGFVSKPGLGTKFYVQVPRTQDQTAPSVHEEAPPQHQAQALVYCIDNDADVLHAMVSWLQSMGYRTQGFMHDDELLEHAAQATQEAPAAILADYHLARGKNGLALIHQLRQQFFTDLPAVIISADTSEALKETLSDSDVVLMSKPVKPLALRSVLNRLI